jgi:DNA-binding NtrC family response regulator
MAKVAILCVDDEAIILNSLVRQLQTAFDDAYLYETAESADEALEIIEELQSEGTVSDWLMPGAKGDEFLIEVHKRFPGVVKIMLTGQADRDAIERAIDQANLYTCLEKPWQAQDLIQAIQSALPSVESSSVES